MPQYIYFRPLENPSTFLAPLFDADVYFINLGEWEVYQWDDEYWDLVEWFKDQTHTDSIYFTRLLNNWIQFTIEPEVGYCGATIDELAEALQETIWSGTNNTFEKYLPPCN